MGKPSRNSSPDSAELKARTFFVSTKTSLGKHILQSGRMATLLIDVLRSHTYVSKFKVHDFVVMPNHLHVLLTVGDEMSIENAVQLIKGNFSYRARKELGYVREIWQRGFSEVRIANRASFLVHRKYIYDNPVMAGLADSPEKFPYSSAFFRAKKCGNG